MFQKLKDSAKLIAPAVILIILALQLAAQAESKIALKSGDVTWTFDTHAGLSLLRVEQASSGKRHLIIDHPEGRPLYDLAVTAILPAKAKMNSNGGYDWKPGPGLIDPASFKVISVKNLTINGKKAVEFKMNAATSAGDIKGDIKIVAKGRGEVVFFAKITPSSPDYYLKTTLRGPIFEDINIGRDGWYFFPRGHGIYSANPCRLASYYGQYAWMQCMGCYGRDTGLVLSIVPLEHEAQPKLFINQKAGEESKRVIDNSYDAPLHADLLNKSGITQTIVWPKWVAEIGKSSVYGPVAVRIRSNGDWHDIYGHYREYLLTWWKPKPASRNYVRHSYFEASAWSNCGDTKQEWANWALPFHDWVEGFLTKPMSLSRNLEYSLVGYKNPYGIRDIYSEWRKRGVRSTVYVHGKAVDPKDEFAKKYAYDLTLDTPPAGEAGGGPPGTGATDGLHWMNLHAKQWREHLGYVTTDILKKTGADGIRLDCIGFTMFGGGNGSNPRIYTPPTQHDYMLKGSVETVAYVRKAMDKVNKDATLGAENLGTDLMMNLLDYSLSYNVFELCMSSRDLYPSPVDYVRFVFPDFKLFEITGEPHFDGSTTGYASEMVSKGSFTKAEDIYRESLHVMLFNGTGIAGWNRAPNHIELLKTCSRVLNENTNCYEGAVAVPEIPTLKKGVYANQFAVSKKALSPRIVTLMNWTHEQVSGPLVQLSLLPGERVVELVGLNNVATDAGGRASLSIDPMRSAVLRVIPGIIRARRNNGGVSIEVPNGLQKGQKLIAYVAKPDGRIISAQVKLTGRKTAVISKVGSEDRVAVQLMHLFLKDTIKPKYVIDDIAIVAADKTSKQFELYTYLEGENLKVAQMQGGYNSTQMPEGIGKENRQDIAWDLGLSGTRQFGWHGNQNGDQLDLNISAPAKGTYEVFASFGRGTLYGIYEISINGRHAASLDLYSVKAGSTGEVSLGKYDLEKGENTLDVRCMGYNKLSASSREFDFSRVVAACIRFGSSPCHRYWIDGIHFRNNDNTSSIPREPFDEEAGWDGHFSIIYQPSLPSRHYGFRDFIPSPTIFADTTVQTEGKQSIRHEDPGWAPNSEVAFGILRGNSYNSTLPWNMTRYWIWNMDIMIHSTDDTFREAMIIDADGNRLVKDISAMVPHNGSDFTHLAIKLGDMKPDPQSGKGSTFGLDYIRLAPAK